MASAPQPNPESTDEKLAAIMARLTELEEYKSRTQNLETRHQELANDFVGYRRLVRDGLNKIAAALEVTDPNRVVVSDGLSIVS